jgi:hypothetical protein
MIDMISDPMISCRWLAKHIVSLAIMGQAVILASPVVARDHTFTVSVSDVVQEQINSASPSKRKKLEAAVRAGNKFIPYHFDGSAHEAEEPEGWKFWQQKILPLINKNARQWLGDGQDANLKKLEIDGRADGPTAMGAIVAVCPNIKLVAVSTAENRNTTSWYPRDFSEASYVLEYEVGIIGIFNGWTDPPQFTPNRDGTYETVLVSVDKNNKISQLAYQYVTWTKPAEFFHKIMLGMYADSPTPESKAPWKMMLEQLKTSILKVCKERN